jgi:hypothetical protein
LASPRAVSLMFSCCDSFSIGCSVLDHKTWVDRDNFRVQTKLLHRLDCLSVSSSLAFSLFFLFNPVIFTLVLQIWPEAEIK